MQQITLALVKFYEELEFAKKFIAEGEMYCQSLQYFIDLENNSGDCERGDNLEGTSHIIQKENLDLDLTINMHFQNGNSIVKRVTQKSLEAPLYIQPDSAKYNVFCMYQLKGFLVNTEPYYYYAEKPNLGRYAVVVYNTEEFITRVKKTAQDLESDLFGKFIQYYDDHTDTKIFNEKERIFWKRKKYQEGNQNEYRFAFCIPNNNRSARAIRIGNINDIAYLIDTKE